MSKYIIIFISFFFAVGCVPTARNQWVSTIKVKPHEVPVSEAFLERVRANWYYNTKTKCYGINEGFYAYLEWGLYTTDQNTMKLNKKQFIAIFGQPDFIYKDMLGKEEYDRFINLYIDFEMRANLGYSWDTYPHYYSGRCASDLIYWNPHPHYYSGELEEGRIHFFENWNSNMRDTLYRKKFDIKKLDSLYQSVTADYKPIWVDSIVVDSRGITRKFVILSNMHELQAIRDKKAKSIIRDYFFYNKKAKHYIWISGFPLPSSCDSKAEVKRLFGKPTKVEANGDLIYHISLPGRYGRPNYIRWSPLPNGKYSVTVNIER